MAPFWQGELEQASVGVVQRRSAQPGRQAQLKSTVLPCGTERHTPPFMHGPVVQGLRTWQRLPTYPSLHLGDREGVVRQECTADLLTREGTSVGQGNDLER